MKPTPPVIRVTGYLVTVPDLFGTMPRPTLADLEAFKRELRAALSRR